MLQEFQDSSTYGVWIDGKRVENSTLKNYSTTDFHHFLKSKLYKGAKHYGRYTYQLDLITKKAIEGEASGRWVKSKVGKVTKQKAQKHEEDH
jgi:hypothetical protein